MTKRLPLPKGSVSEIDNALMEISDGIRVILTISRKPDADGRLVEVIHHLHEAITFLNKAKEPDPIKSCDSIPIRANEVDIECQELAA